jgi:hypothetical protein
LVFLSRTTTITLRTYENEELRMLRTKRKQLETNHIMFNRYSLYTIMVIETMMDRRDMQYAY